MQEPNSQAAQSTQSPTVSHLLTGFPTINFAERRLNDCCGNSGYINRNRYCY